VGAGLLIGTFVELSRVDTGFRTDGIVRFQVTAPSVRYGTLEEQRDFFRTFEARVASLPGVDTVGSAFAPPLGRGRATAGVRVEGRLPGPRGEEPLAELSPVGPGWLETYGIGLLRGRALRPEDELGDGPAPAVVNRAFVERIFPDEEPLGQVIEVGVNFGWGQPPLEIVGVVEDIRNAALEEEAGPQVYAAHGRYGRSSMNVAVRVAPGLDPGSVVGPVRDELRALDPEIPLSRVETLEDVVGRELAPTRLYLTLLGFFAGAALLLAAVGLYGVVAYAVSSRTREIGIRLALGAEAGRVVRRVMAEGLRPTAAGLAAGLAGSLVAGRLLESLVYGIRPTEPLAIVAAAGLLAVVALLAVFVPARWAAAGSGLTHAPSGRGTPAPSRKIAASPRGASASTGTVGWGASGWSSASATS